MKNRYPKDWTAISLKTRETALWRCAVCAAKHEDTAGKRIQVHHLDYDPTNSSPDNLVALCPPCHLDRHKRKQGSISPGQMTIIQLLEIPPNNSNDSAKIGLTPLSPAPSVDRGIKKQDLDFLCQLSILEGTS